MVAGGPRFRYQHETPQMQDVDALSRQVYEVPSKKDTTSLKISKTTAETDNWLCVTKQLHDERIRQISEKVE